MFVILILTLFILVIALLTFIILFLSKTNEFDRQSEEMQKLEKQVKSLKATKIEVPDHTSSLIDSQNRKITLLNEQLTEKDRALARNLVNTNDCDRQSEEIKKLEEQVRSLDHTSSLIDSQNRKITLLNDQLTEKDRALARNNEQCNKTNDCERQSEEIKKLEEQVMSLKATKIPRNCNSYIGVPYESKDEQVKRILDNVQKTNLLGIQFLCMTEKQTITNYIDMFVHQAQKQPLSCTDIQKNLDNELQKLLESDKPHPPDLIAIFKSVTLIIKDVLMATCKDNRVDVELMTSLLKQIFDSFCNL